MKVTFTTATAKGLRPYQEDRFVTHVTNEGVLLAVFDGHGGESTAEFCHKALDETWDFFAGDEPEVRLKRTVAKLNDFTQFNHDGSTASLVFIPEGAAKAFVAVLGDSPVVIGGKKAIVPVEGQEPTTALYFTVSPEHNVRTNQKEADAVKDRGGIVSHGYAMVDIYGYGLQMARALGDSGLAQILSREPETYSENLDTSSFVLVATDGVFDPGHADTEAAVADVVALIDKGGDAQAIVDRAVRLRTGDNATAILVRFE